MRQIVFSLFIMATTLCGIVLMVMSRGRLTTDPNNIAIYNYAFVACAGLFVVALLSTAYHAGRYNG